MIQILTLWDVISTITIIGDLLSTTILLDYSRSYFVLVGLGMTQKEFSSIKEYYKEKQRKGFELTQEDRDMIGSMKNTK